MSDVVDGLEGELRSNAISVERLSTGETAGLAPRTAFLEARVDHGAVGRVRTAFVDLAGADERGTEVDS
jgi:hypothetical protein